MSYPPDSQPSMTTTRDTESDRSAVEREPAVLLGAAIARQQAARGPGVRDRYRRELLDVIEAASRVLATGGEPAAQPAAQIAAQWTLLRAHVARADNARHGANQLSQGSQRTPTLGDCEDGWQRVEETVRDAEESGREARRLADEIGRPEAQRLARVAERSARDARRIVDERNNAYTFHADPGFSFGEGWYAAASALLAGASIQIEPGRPQTAQAERFLHDAGLAESLVPYRPRPRANKQLTAIVADAFRPAPTAAQQRVRAAFLGDEPIGQAIVEQVNQRVGGRSGPKVLLWIRRALHDPERNTAYSELVALSQISRDLGLAPVLFGDAIPQDAGGREVPAGAPADRPADWLDLTLIWKEPFLQGPDMRRAQLQLFEELRHRHGVIGQVGVTTAGMDGPALLGLPTIYLTQEPNPRLGRWVGAIPGYQEVVQRDGYLEAIRETLARWRGESDGFERQGSSER